MKLKYEIIIIGGGPSGMAAAISASKRTDGKDILLLEKNKIVGRKLLATGNGHCNMTNLACENAEMILAFFHDIGILHRVSDGGRVYPYTLQAASLNEALERELKRRGVTILTDMAVKTNEVRKLDEEFIVRTEKLTFFAKSLIVATGGKAGPQYGSDGDGYGVAKSFGHTIIKPIPSLVQVTCQNETLKDLKGVRIKGTATIGKSELSSREILDSELGEIQFTESGLSGICIFNLSRNIRLTKAEDKYTDYFISLDLMPEYSREEIQGLLEKGFSLSGMLPKKVAIAIDNESDNSAEKAARLIKNWNFVVTGTKGFKEAQVTSGGVPLNEINKSTMQSLKTKKLFFVGEVIDYDGKCGGFNLQWAFETGIYAGESVNV